MNQRWPRCRTGRNVTADAASPPRCGGATWSGRRHSEPVRPGGEPSLIRHHPQRGSPRVGCGDGSCSVPDWTSSVSTLGSEADSVVPPRPSRVRRPRSCSRCCWPPTTSWLLDQLATLSRTLPDELSCGVTLRRDHGAFTV